MTALVCVAWTRLVTTVKIKKGGTDLKEIEEAGFTDLVINVFQGERKTREKGGRFCRL